MGFWKRDWLVVINMGENSRACLHNHEKGRLSNRFLFALFMFNVSYLKYEKI